MDTIDQNSNDQQLTDIYQKTSSSTTSPQTSRPPSTTPILSQSSTTAATGLKIKLNESTCFKNNPLIDNADKKLCEQDEKLVELCLQLHQQTYCLTETTKLKSEVKSWQNHDEFSQAGIKQSVTFCMQLPGNRDLCTEDRAKLLKYGAYEIVLLRLASRYSLLEDKIVLSNGISLCENDLMQHAFGCYGHTFFQYCRNFNKFNLLNEELAVFECFIFYSFDRPLLKDRKKVEQLQMKYCELLRYLCAKNHRSDEMFFAKLLLSVMKLRALDALSK